MPACQVLAYRNYEVPGSESHGSHLIHYSWDYGRRFNGNRNDLLIPVEKWNVFVLSMSHTEAEHWMYNNSIATGIIVKVLLIWDYEVKARSLLI